MPSPKATESSIDEVDRGIIHHLQLDARAPYRVIADVLEVSEQTVARRYRRLRSGGLLRVVTVVSSRSFGQSTWMVRIQARPDSARPLARALADRDDVTWVIIGGGGTEVTAALQSRSAAERDDLLLDRLPRHAQVLGLTVQSVMHRFSQTGGVDWTVRSPLISAERERAILAAKPALDLDAEVRVVPEDEKLIAALSVDGRTSVAQLSQQTGWSEARANRRMSALLMSGAIYFDVDIAEWAFGFSFSVELWLTVEPAHLQAVGQALADLPEIAFCAALTGGANLTAVALFRRAEDLYPFVTGQIGRLPGVRQVDLSPVIQKIKQAGSFVENGRLTRTPAVGMRAS